MKRIINATMFAAVALATVIAAADDSGRGGFSWRTDDRSFSLFDGSQLVLKFNYAFLDHANLGVPESESRRFAGDYVYPLNGISGENLVDDAPKDHYHHHGMFWTWPGVFVHQEDGSVRSYDLWTSNTKIRQRFLNLDSMEVRDDSAVLVVRNGWFIEGGATEPDEKLDSTKTGLAIASNEKYYGEKIVDETIALTIHSVKEVEGVKTRSVDVELTLTPCSKDVSLQGAEKKSYGGLTIRFKPQGKNGVDKFISTDEGVAADDMPEKRLRWADYALRRGSDKPFEGASIFLSPDFPDFPPTWLTRYYGPLCVGFPGVEARRFKAGEPVSMKARVFIHEGLLSPETLTKIYESSF